MAATLSEYTSSSTLARPAFRARARQASSSRRPIPCRLHSSRTPIPSRPTCVNPLAGFGMMSQNPTTSPATANTCGRESSITRFRKARVCSGVKPSTLAKYHFSAATALTAAQAEAVSDSRAGLICTCRPLLNSRPPGTPAQSRLLGVRDRKIDADLLVIGADEVAEPYRYTAFDSVEGEMDLLGCRR